MSWDVVSEKCRREFAGQEEKGPEQVFFDSRAILHLTMTLEGLRLILEKGGKGGFHVVGLTKR